MRGLFGLVAVAAVVISGCDKPTKVAVFPVRGQVIYDGKPAAGVQVFLFPTAAPGVPDIPTNPHGVTGEDGRFEVGTYGETDGAAEGSYQVVLYWPAAAGEERHESSEDRLLGWYTVARSKLTAAVPPGGADLPPFKLPAVKGPPAESGGGIPGRN